MQPPHVLERDEPVLVSVCDDHIVISPAARLDVRATRSLINVAAAAVRSGSTVMIDLDPETPSGDLISHGPVSGGPDAVLGEITGFVELLGPGVVRLRTAESYWTIDLAQSRLFRSEKPIATCFVSADRWTRIAAIWVSCASITALTDDGSYLSCRTVWTT